MPRENEWDTAALIAADKKFVWHPFTQMGEWCAPEHEPIVLVKGKGALLWDSEGRQYIDGNSSIWTNIHGHNHPHINAAIRRQLDLVAHTSFLGFTNPAAIKLAKAIVGLFPPATLSRVFFSDDGSTGMEAALRIVEQFWQLQDSSRSEFVAFRDGYHGDTAGAASLGANAMFGNAASGWRPPVTQVASIAELERLPAEEVKRIAAVVIEPLVQGAAGMKIWPAGTLAALRAWCTRAGVLLIADEVLTAFGRTGRMFACEHEEAFPDIIVLGKALTGGYLPLAITAVTEKIFAPFAGCERPENTLFYGHSYTGNALACAAASASLEVFDRELVLNSLEKKIALLHRELAAIESLPSVREVRQCGFIAAIELSTDDQDAGKVVCLAARRGGLLTRPIRNNVVLMPPFCITESELAQSVAALRTALLEVHRPAASISESRCHFASS